MKKLITVVVLMTALATGVFADDVDDKVINHASTGVKDVQYYLNIAIESGWTLYSVWSIDKDCSYTSSNGRREVAFGNYIEGVGDRAGYTSRKPTDYVEIVVTHGKGKKAVTEGFRFRRPE
jgi:opacity protein-like surface antigen